MCARRSYAVNMLETPDDDHGLTPEEQTEILMMAARLQEEQRERMSVDQLELLAQEAGIDPPFVRMAIERRGGTALSSAASSRSRRWP